MSGTSSVLLSFVASSTESYVTGLERSQTLNFCKTGEMEHTACLVLLFLVSRFTPTVSFCEEHGQVINLDEINNHFTDLLQGLDLVLDQFNVEKGVLFKFVFLPGSIDARRIVKDGNKFCVRVQIAPSSWRNTVENMSKRIDKCPVNFSDQKAIDQTLWCDIEMLSRPWLNNIQIQKRVCQRVLQKSGVIFLRTNFVDSNF